MAFPIDFPEDETKARLDLATLMRDKVVGFIRKGADEHINQLCLRYNIRSGTY